MISPGETIRRIGSTLFVVVPEEATQFFWQALEPSVVFEDDPRWMGLVRHITRLLVWIAALMSFALMPLAFYSILVHGALIMGIFSAYTAGVGSVGFVMALRGISHDRRWRHIAVTPEELSDEAVIGLANARAQPEAHRLNELID